MPGFSHTTMPMTQLPVELQGVHPKFTQGGFAVQTAATNPLGMYLLIKQQERLSTGIHKTPDGTKGFSLKEGAVRRYFHI